MEKSEFNDDGFAAQEEYFRDMSSYGRSTFLRLEQKTCTTSDPIFNRRRARQLHGEGCSNEIGNDGVNNNAH